MKTHTGNNYSSRNILFSAALGLLLFAAGVLYCLYYGRIGYMPQDSATVFDGGWRILSGQIPFRDFTLSNAIIPVFLQGFFFKIFGVSWLVYCLHAAVFNGLFCVLAFFFLRLFGGSRPLSFFYALLSGVIFYTPFGIPVQDQHAYFFTVLVIFLACLSARVSRPVIKQAMFFFIPVITVVAFLSKQIPTVFGVCLALAIILFSERKNLWAPLRSILAGTLAAIVILAVLYHALGIDDELLKTYFFQLPAETGGQRAGWILSGRFALVKRYMVSHWGLFFPLGLVTLLFLFSLLLTRIRFEISEAKPSGKKLAWLIRQNRFSLLYSAVFVIICVLFIVTTNDQLWIGLVALFFLVSLWLVPLRFIIPDSKFSVPALVTGVRRNFLLLLLAEALLVICFVFVSMTSNQGENGVPLIFISLGLTHLFLLRVIRQESHADLKSRFLKQHPMVFATGLLLCGFSLWCAWNFDRDVNKTRMVHDMTGMEKQIESPQPDMLSFLVWKTPDNYTGTPGDFLRIMDFFRRNGGNFYLLGDSSILYALTGRPSVSPVLWLHPGQTIPLKTSVLFPAFQRRFMQMMRQYNVRYVVLEAAWITENNLYHCPPGSTWSCTNLSDFPALQDLVLKSGEERERFGPFKIIELRPFDEEQTGNRK